MDTELSNKIEQLLEAGDKTQARKLLGQSLRTNPNNVKGWILLSQTVDDLERKRQALEYALKLDPSNQEAQTELQRLDSPLDDILREPAQEKTSRPRSRKTEKAQSKKDNKSTNRNNEDKLFYGFLPMAIMIVGCPLCFVCWGFAQQTGHGGYISGLYFLLCFVSLCVIAAGVIQGKISLFGQ